MFLLAALGETLYHSQIEYKYELINGFWGVFFFFAALQTWSSGWTLLTLITIGSGATEIRLSTTPS